MRSLLLIIAGFMLPVLTAQAATSTANLGVSATVVSTCSVTTGIQSTGGKPVSVSCSEATDYRVSQERGAAKGLLVAGVSADTPIVTVSY